ncbi:hypothetical protein BJX99DRAFT_256109 [Aspergillus californicus]
MAGLPANPVPPEGPAPTDPHLDPAVITPWPPQVPHSDIFDYAAQLYTYGASQWWVDRLSLLDAAEAIALIIRLPHHILQIWEASQSGLGRFPRPVWGLHIMDGTIVHHRPLRTPLEVVNYHRDPYVQGGFLQVGGPDPDPIDPDWIGQNLRGRLDPIHLLIAGRHLDILVLLHDRGLWDPCSWSVRGDSYLKTAILADWDELVDYIVAQAASDPRRDWNFIRSEVSVSAVTGAPCLANHLDMLLDHGAPARFWTLWDAISNLEIDLGLRLTQRSQRTLCLISSHAQALELDLHGIDLSTVVQGPNNPAGTVWHLALQNPDVSFLDYLNDAATQPIDDLAGAQWSPLAQAWQNRALVHFDYLLEIGADANTVIPDLMESFPDPDDPFFMALLPVIGHRPPVIHNAVYNVNSTINELHHLVRGLLETFQLPNLPNPRNLAHPRAAVIRKAVKLVGLLKRQNRHGVVNLNDVFWVGGNVPGPPIPCTPRQLAELWQLPWPFINTL